MLDNRKIEWGLNAELERLKKDMKMINSGTDTLDHILIIGKTSTLMHVLDILAKALNRRLTLSNQ